MGRIHFSLPGSQQNSPPVVFKRASPWLAPLAGYSDLSFRLLCREQGAAICETEMISAKGLLYNSSATNSLLASCQTDQPLAVQLFGGEPESMAQAVLLLRAKGYQFFDCNMGCPVRKVQKQHAGAALMADAARATQIARAMLTACKTSSENLPETPAMLGFKLRLPPKNGHITDFAKKLEELGASWITLHPRTACQGYSGLARHEYTQILADKLNIPVIASGDAFSGEAGLKILNDTGAAAIMFGRGALYNPAIFVQFLNLLNKKSSPDKNYAQTAKLIRRHIELAFKYDANPRRSFVKMRSIIPRYVKTLPGINELRNNLNQCQNWNELNTVICKFFLEHGVSINMDVRQ